MFDWLRKPREVPPAWEDRLKRVEKTQEDLERSVRALKLEWEDTYDRIARVLDRLNARAKQQHKKEEEPEPQTAPAVSDSDVNAAILAGTFPYLNGRRVA